jgi:RNA polymerase sigma-70 factor, ECF subfamily
MCRMEGKRATSAEIEAIYRTRSRAFLLSVTALLGDAEAALDVVQDGFALALRRRASFGGEGGVEGWLWRIVLNVARDRGRSLRREGRAHHRLEPTGDVSESDDELRALVLALPERQRLTIFLRYYADLSYGQIAEALGVSPGTVAASLSTGHATVRRDLEEVTG